MTRLIRLPATANGRLILGALAAVAVGGVGMAAIARSDSRDDNEPDEGADTGLLGDSRPLPRQFRPF